MVLATGGLEAPEKGFGELNHVEVSSLPFSIGPCVPTQLPDHTREELYVGNFLLRNPQSVGANRAVVHGP